MSKENKLDAKAVLKAAAKEERVVKLSKRVKLEIIKDSGFYTKGQLVSPHIVFGQELVKKGIAKEIK